MAALRLSYPGLELCSGRPIRAFRKESRCRRVPLFACGLHGDGTEEAEVTHELGWDTVRTYRRIVGEKEEKRPSVRHGINHFGARHS